MSQYNYPNARNNAGGAIPVYMSAGPKAMPIRIVAATGIAFGPIPVRVVAGPGHPSSNQGSDAGAIPVVVSASPKAMPVWRIN